MSFFQRHPKLIKNFDYEKWMKGIPYINFVDQELMQAIRTGNIKKQQRILKEKEKIALINQIENILSKGEFVTKKEKEQLIEEMENLRSQVIKQPVEIREYLEKTPLIPTKNNVLVINDIGYKIEFNTNEELIEQLEAIENEKIGEYRIGDIIEQSFESLFDHLGIKIENIHSYKDYINNTVFIKANKKQRQKYKKKNLLYFPHGYAYKNQDIQLARNEPSIKFKHSKTTLRDTKTVTLPIKLGTKVEEIGDIIEEEGDIKLKINSDNPSYQYMIDFVEREINSENFTKKYMNIKYYNVSKLINFLNKSSESTLYHIYINNKGRSMLKFKNDDKMKKEVMQEIINDSLRWKQTKQKIMPEDFLNTTEIRERLPVKNPITREKYNKILDNLITYSYKYPIVSANEDTYNKFQTFIGSLGMNKLTSLADYIKYRENIKENIDDWKIILDDYEKNISNYSSPSKMNTIYSKKIREFLEERKKNKKKE